MYHSIFYSSLNEFLILLSLQDAAKVYTYRLLKHFNTFGYNDTGMVPDFLHEIPQGQSPSCGTFLATQTRSNTSINNNINCPTLPTTVHNTSNTPLIKKGE